MESQFMLIKLIKATTLGVAVSVLTACGIAAPKAEVAYAEATIQSAQNVDASQYAGIELEKAKEKLRQAKAEMKEGNNENALRLAKEATADASLAQVKAEAGKAKSAEHQVKESIKSLKAQLK
jgi:hypothetical protein